MRVFYDETRNILYIEIREDKVAETVMVGEGVFIDYNEKGEPVGVEVWDADKIAEAMATTIARKVIGYVAYAKQKAGESSAPPRSSP